jgi:hypothetical protein
MLPRLRGSARRLTIGSGPGTKSLRSNRRDRRLRHLQRVTHIICGRRCPIESGRSDASTRPRMGVMFLHRQQPPPPKRPPASLSTRSSMLPGMAIPERYGRGSDKRPFASPCLTPMVVHARSHKSTLSRHLTPPTFDHSPRMARTRSAMDFCSALTSTVCSILGT